MTGGDTGKPVSLWLILGAMLAEVFPCQEIIVPEAPKKMTDGVFTDAASLDVAGKALSAWLAHLQHRRP